MKDTHLNGLIVPESGHLSRMAIPAGNGLVPPGQRESRPRVLLNGELRGKKTVLLMARTAVLTLEDTVLELAQMRIIMAATAGCRRAREVSHPDRLPGRVARRNHLRMALLATGPPVGPGQRETRPHVVLVCEKCRAEAVLAVTGRAIQAREGQGQKVVCVRVGVTIAARGRSSGKVAHPD